jgi:hypothetical protein
VHVSRWRRGRKSRSRGSPEMNAHPLVCACFFETASAAPGATVNPLRFLFRDHGSP